MLTDEEYEKLYDSLLGIYAYDTGSVDSGIKDEKLREEIITYLRRLAVIDRGVEHAQLLARIINEAFLSEESLEYGYTAEDAYKFLQWCDEQGILR